MSILGDSIRQLRTQQDRSRRWVERRSREMYPEQKDRQISHSYVQHLEEGRREKPSPLKLQTLAKILEGDYGELMRQAGYLTPGNEFMDDTRSPTVSPQTALAESLFTWLKARHTTPDYFIQNLMALSDESLAIVTRLVTSLSVQERRLRRESRDVLSLEETGVE